MRGVLLAVLLAFAVASAALADTGCDATLTPELTLHLPVVVLDGGGGIYSADLAHVPSSDGEIWFNLTGLNVVPELQCSEPAVFSLTSMLVSIPSLVIGSDAYWATLEYFPQSPVNAQEKTGISSPQNGSPALKTKGFGNKNATAPAIGEPTQLRFDTVMRYSLTGPETTLKVDFHAWSLVPLDCVSLVANVCHLFPPNVQSPLITTGSTCSYTNPDSTCDCTVSQGVAGNFTVNDLTITNTNTPKPLISLMYELGHYNASANFKCTHNRTGRVTQGSVPLLDYLSGNDLFRVMYDHFHSKESSSPGSFKYRVDNWSINYDWRGFPFDYASRWWAGGEWAMLPDVMEIYEASTKIELKQF